MPQRPAYSSILLSMDSTRAEFQIVATRDHVVLDVQARNYQTDGRAKTECALAHLSRQDAVRLYRLLGEAIAASQEVLDSRQTALWSPATPAAVADELRRGRLS